MLFLSVASRWRCREDEQGCVVFCFVGYLFVCVFELMSTIHPVLSRGGFDASSFVSYLESIYV